MKQILLVAFLVALSKIGQAQTTGPGFIIYVGSAPSGACSAGAYLEQVIGLGTVYTCQSGAWTQLSGGGGGSGTVTSVICGTNLDGGTITVSGTCSVKASPAFTGVPTSPTAAAGTSTTQLATTAFVASAIQGVNPAVAVQAATVAVLPNSPTYSNGASGIGATLTAGSAAALVVDGYTPILNDRILVKTQASSFQNGVYFLSTLGTGIIPYVLTRALDFDQPSDMNNTGAIPVLNGTVNAITQWVISSSVTTVGTDAVTFTQFSSNPATSSGAIVQLETHTASTSASLNFTTCLGTAGYSRFRVEVLNLRPATNGARLELLFSTNGGSSYDSSAIYGYSSFRTNSGGTAVGGASTQTQAIIDDGSTTDNTANFGINATYSITPGGATAYTRMQSLSYSVEGSGAFFETGLSHALYASNTATNAFKIFFDSGNITTGTINCYGVTP